jgi:uncharacterized SAM-dependent methyltransferase
LLVCDLVTATDLAAAIAWSPVLHGARLITFFGMIPNFEPGDILPTLASLLRDEDGLLFSANLAPGADYTAGMQRILPQYDNALTREWLLTFLLDLGVERGDGELRFSIEDEPAGSGLKRVVARFGFRMARTLAIEGEHFEFRPGEDIRLFFSYRYTPERVRAQLARSALHVSDGWITPSGEEGVFLVRRG